MTMIEEASGVVTVARDPKPLLAARSLEVAYGSVVAVRRHQYQYLICPI